MLGVFTLRRRTPKYVVLAPSPRRPEERSRQADAISSWLTPYESGGDEREGDEFDGLVVRNASDQPVFELIASLVSTQGAFRETAVGDDQRTLGRFARS
ncbi:MAG: hypothetical protein M3P26_04205 [Gemmatimonadota bacterium]|nr:hypothetical protein [Gemmatimonadota bacterium]